MIKSKLASGNTIAGTVYYFLKSFSFILQDFIIVLFIVNLGNAERPSVIAALPKNALYPARAMNFRSEFVKIAT